MDSKQLQQQPQFDRIIRPNPDPTLLTTTQLLRELENLRDLICTRLDGMDKAMVLFQNSITSAPTDTDRQISHLRELHSEKFESIQSQFRERDTRTDQTSRDSKVAVDAALQAAKEAVGEQNKSNSLANAKMETSFTKQLDQLGQLVNSMAGGLSDKIDDLRVRLTSLEGQKKGVVDGWGYIVGGVGILLAAATVVIAVLKTHAA